jgi:hypothetical protein
MTIPLSPFASVAVGFLMGLGSIIVLVKRLDRSGEGGCFYTLLLGVVVVTLLAILAGAWWK